MFILKHYKDKDVSVRTHKRIKRPQKKIWQQKAANPASDIT